MEHDDLNTEQRNAALAFLNRLLDGAMADGRVPQPSAFGIVGMDDEESDLVYDWAEAVLVRPELSRVSLEDDFQPNWADAKSRLNVAAELLGYPFLIVLDERAEAFKNTNDYGVHTGNLGASHYLGVFFEQSSKLVTNMREAKDYLYPWFHDGRTRT